MPTDKRLYRPLLILMLIGLVLGLYKAAVSGCISNDSVLFLEYADRLQTEPVEVIKTHYQHPGYPAAIWAAQRLLERFTGPLSVQQQIFAGQAVNLLSRTVAVVFIYLIFLRFAGRKTAFFNTLLVLLIPAYANNGSDVLSDWPNLMFMSIAFWACLKGFCGPRPGWFLAAGIASGLAYWVRPEGLFVGTAAGLFIFLHLFYTQRKLKWLTCLAAVVIPPALIAAPYMRYTGAVFPKKDVGTFSATLQTGKLPSVQTVRAQAAAANIADYVQGPLHFLEEAFNTIYLLLIPLCAAVYRQVRRFKTRRRRDRFLLLFIGLWLLMLLLLYGLTGYMSHRHLMPLLIFSCAWAWQGLLVVVPAFTKTCRNLRRNAFILLLVCAAVFVPKLVRPAHADKSVYRRAGLWLDRNTPENALLSVFDNRIAYYAQRPYWRIKPNRRLRGDYLVIRPDSTDVTIPDSAVRLQIPDPAIDAAIAVYALRSHQE